MHKQKGNKLLGFNKNYISCCSEIKKTLMFKRSP